MQKESGVIAILFVALFALLAGWTAHRAIKAHQDDNDLIGTIKVIRTDDDSVN